MQQRRSMYPTLAIVLALSGSQGTQNAVSVEDYLSLRNIEAVAVSTAAQAVAFTVSRVDLDSDNYFSELNLWRRAGGALHIAPGFADVRLPRWSPGGTSLAFLSAGPSGGADPQIWVMPVSGGSPGRLQRPEGETVSFDWSSDSVIYALVRVPGSERSEIWRLRVEGGGAERLWRTDRLIGEIAVSPDGGSIVYTVAATEPAGYDYDLVILDLESLSTLRISSRSGPKLAPVWSPNGRSVIFRAPGDPDRRHTQIELFQAPSRGGQLVGLTSGFDRSVIDHRWPRDGDLLFSAAVGTHTHIFTISAGGAIVPVTDGAYNYGAFDASGSTIYGQRESAMEAAELWRIDATRTERLTNINRQARSWKLGRQEVINWRAPDGLNVEGLLVYPVAYQPDRSYPLLVIPSGGPSNRVRDVLAQTAGYQLFAARGYAVLAVNPRGSRGYGEDFAQASRSDLAGGDLVDLLAGIDRVLESGVADPQRLAIYGEGYGAHLASWALTRTQRFKAAIADYDDSPSRIPPFAASSSAPMALDAATWQMLETQRSPATAVDDINTPLLIIGNSLASSPAAAQGRELRQALLAGGRAVEYLDIDAGEDRTPRQLSEIFFRKLRWFDRYLKFAGANLFDFYLAGEWVPGVRGWELRVQQAGPQIGYADVVPDSGRYLDIVLTFRVSDHGEPLRAPQGLTIDPATSITLLGPDSAARPFAGTVAEFFGRETLLQDSTSVLRVNAPAGGTPPAVTLRLAYEIPDHAAEYRLIVSDFAPVRIWVRRRD